MDANTKDQNALSEELAKLMLHHAVRQSAYQPVTIREIKAFDTRLDRIRELRRLLGIH